MDLDVKVPKVVLVGDCADARDSKKANSQSCCEGFPGTAGAEEQTYGSAMSRSVSLTILFGSAMADRCRVRLMCVCGLAKRSCQGQKGGLGCGAAQAGEGDGRKDVKGHETHRALLERLKQILQKNLKQQRNEEQPLEPECWS
jgi:hypothetical protein